MKISVSLPAEPSIRKILDQHAATTKQIQTDLAKTQSGLTKTQITLERSQTSRTKLQDDLTTTQATFAKSQATFAKALTDFAATQTELSELRAEYNITKMDMEVPFPPSTCYQTGANSPQEMRDRAKREDRLRFTAFKANLMTGFVKKLSMKQKVNIPSEAKGKNDPLHDSTKYMNAASTLFDKFTAEEFKKRTGLDPAYRVFLGNYRKFIEARREWAHETDEEFARLLLSRQFQEEPFRTKENVEQ